MKQEIIEFVKDPVSGKRRRKLEGLRFERIEVLKCVGPMSYGPLGYLCRCDCGKEWVTNGNAIARGQTKSCGCWARDGLRLRSRKHGHCSDDKKKMPKEYMVWASMKSRCYNPQHVAYADYGGRGIVVCDRWRESFETFFADMGPRPTPRHTIDRIDNDLGYWPENCRWATKREQQNNRRVTTIIEFEGKRMPLTYWAEQKGINPITLAGRLKKGWSNEDALTYAPGERPSQHDCAGEKAPRAILSEQDVRDIRERAAKGSRYGLIKRLAKHYRVSYGCICGVIYGRNWSTVT
jgi:hypothetical protein